MDEHGFHLYYHNFKSKPVWLWTSKKLHKRVFFGGPSKPHKKRLKRHCLPGITSIQSRAIVTILCNGVDQVFASVDVLYTDIDSLQQNELNRLITNTTKPKKTSGKDRRITAFKKLFCFVHWKKALLVWRINSQYDVMITTIELINNDDRPATAITPAD